MFKILADIGWTYWIFLFHMTVHIIVYMFYQKDTSGYNRASRQRWKRIRTIGQHVTTLATKLGDMIERNLQSDRTTRRERRIILATHMQYRRTSTALLAMTVLAMQANATITSGRETRFDTDSADIGIDNRCSACISHKASDFEGELLPCNRVVKGFGGSRTTNIKTGTLKWSWEDDHGMVTTFRIPNSYYVPDGKVRLLSPQHWAQTQATNRKQRHHYGERTTSHQCVLFWNDGNSKRTVPLGRADNVVSFSLAPGYDNFEAFCSATDLLDPSDGPIAFPSGIISDDDDDREDEVEPDDVSPTTWTGAPDEPTYTLPTAATPVDFNLDGPTTSTPEGEGTASMTSTTNIIIDEEDRQPEDLAQLLMYHHQYGHISMKKLQEMAKQRIIPKRLQSVESQPARHAFIPRQPRNLGEERNQRRERVETLRKDPATLCQLIS